MDYKQGKCYVCKETALLMCQVCGEGYCSSKCQLEDWPKHKYICHSMPTLISYRQNFGGEQRARKFLSVESNDLLEAEQKSGKLAAQVSSLQAKLEFSNLVVQVPNQQAEQLPSEQAAPVTSLRSKEVLSNQTEQAPNKQADQLASKLAEPVTTLRAKEVISNQTEQVFNKQADQAPTNKAEQALTKRIEQVESKKAAQEFSAIVPLKTVSLPSAWRQWKQYPKNKYFNCMLSAIDPNDETIVWLIGADELDSLQTIEENIRRWVPLQRPIQITDINIDQLCVVLIDCVYFRAQILAVKSDGSAARVKLIDYGTVHAVPLKFVYAAVQEIATQAACAFNVKLMHKPQSSSKAVTVHLLDKPGDIQMAELLPAMPLQKLLEPNLVVRLIRVVPSMSVILISVGVKEQIEKAFLNLNDDMSELCEVKDDTFVAAKTENGWARAYTVGSLPKLKVYLVYLIDEGVIMLCNEVAALPPNILELPINVLSVKINDSGNKAMLQQLSEGTNDFKLQLALDKETDKYKSQLNAYLGLDGDTLHTVRINHFLGGLHSFGIPLDNAPIHEDAKVCIVNMNDCRTLLITTDSALKHYRGMFQEASVQCPPYKNITELKQDAIVLVVKSAKECFRGKIDLHIVSEDVDTEYIVKDIDTGKIHKVPLNYLRKAINFVYFIPVMLRTVSLSMLDKLTEKTLSVDSAAKQKLYKYIENCTVFQIKYNRGPNEEVDLKFCDNNENETLSSELINLLLSAPKVPKSNTNATVVDTKSKPKQDLDTNSNLTPDKEINDQLNRLNLAGAAPQPHTTNILKSVKVEEMSADEAFCPSLPPTPPLSTRDLNLRYGGLSTLTLTPELESNYLTAYTLADVERKQIPVGENIPILILDQSLLLSHGYVYAMSFDRKDEYEALESLRDKIVKYGQCLHKKTFYNYTPRHNDLCLARYSADDDWYRGVYLETCYEGPVIQYLDYGNIEPYDKRNVQPIPKDFLYPIYGSACYIENFDTTNLDIDMVLALSHKTIFICNSVKRKGDHTYLIKLY